MRVRRCNKVKIRKAWLWVFTTLLGHMQADFVHLLCKNAGNGVRLSEKKQLEKQAWCRSIIWKITKTNWAKALYPNVLT